MTSRAGQWVRWAATALATVLIVSGIWAIDAASDYAARPQLSAYDDDWDDLDILRSTLEDEGIPTACTASTAIAIEKIPYPVETVVMVLGVEREYSEREVSAMVDFVTEWGGTLVIADDFGFGDALAQEFGIGFSGTPVRYFGPEVGGRIVPVGMRTALNSTVTYDVLLNDASYIVSDRWGGKNVIASTPSSCWLDIDADVDKDPEEPIASVPVAVRLDLGGASGTVFFISDPSIFINGMITQRENMAFALSLVDKIRQFPNRMVLFDESRHTPEGTGEVVQRVLYSVAEGALSLAWGALYAGVVLAILIVIGMLVARSPAQLHHHDVLEDPAGVRLDTSFERFPVYYRLRAIILERTRIRYHMSPWDFYTAYIGSLPEDLSDWGLRSSLEERALDTSGLEALEREIRSEYGHWPGQTAVDVQTAQDQRVPSATGPGPGPAAPSAPTTPSAPATHWGARVSMEQLEPVDLVIDVDAEDGPYDLGGGEA